MKVTEFKTNYLTFLRVIKMKSCPLSLNIVAIMFLEIAKYYLVIPLSTNLLMSFCRYLILFYLNKKIRSCRTVLTDIIN